MPKFATYFHPQLTQQHIKPLDEIRFLGHSIPHFEQVRAHLTPHLTDYPQLELRQADGNDYLAVHDADYLDKLNRMARDEKLEEYPRLSGECLGYQYFLEAYAYGLGGYHQAIDAMQHGDLERAYLFALGGHHAHPNRAHGYSILNTVAASVRYAQQHGFAKILIVDWDIHHGDGTQTIFENDPSVYHISSHSLVDLYMAGQQVLKLGTTGYAESVGHRNIPLLDTYFTPAIIEKLSWESDYYRAEDSLRVWREAVEDLPFSPDLIYIFSGYDSHHDDCGKRVTNWQNADYQTLTRMIVEMANKHHCPIISQHGGGYQLAVTVSAAQTHIEVLAHE